MTDEPRRYTEAELRQRLADRSERIEAAIGAGLLLHEYGRAAFLASRIQRLADGRIALSPEDFQLILQELGRVTSANAIQAALNAIFHEESA